MQHSHQLVLSSAQTSSGDLSSSPLRLHLAESAPTSSHVDGAWWPRSTDLAAELPVLLESIHARTGDVALVGFHRDGWDRMTDGAQLADKTIWLEGFTDEKPHTVIVIGSSGRRLTLLVVPPDTADAITLEELVARSHAQSAGADTAVEGQRWLGELTARLAAMEGATNERRTQTIERWVREAAVEFVDAPVQAFVPILVEHIVRQQITVSPLRSSSRV